MGKLTIKKCREATRPGLHGDGGTLYLRVAPGGSKQWVQRLTIRGMVRDIGLGGFPLVSLNEARERAWENRRCARQGGDPRSKKSVPTFREAAAACHKALMPTWKNAVHGKQWIRTLETYAFPVIGDARLDAIDRADVLRILTPIWSTKAETARRVRQRIRSVLKWAQAHNYIIENAAGEGIDGALAKRPKLQAHFNSLPYAEVPAAVESFRSYPGIAARLFVQFAILTAARPGEARLATWAEIDRERRTWTLSPERMKASREHRVPLSDAALAVLDQAEAIRDGGDYIFPSPMKPGSPLSNATGKKLLRAFDLAERATLHGFRSSFRNWCAETGKGREDAELSLSHAIPGVEGAYFRSDLFDRRRRLMDQWAAFVTGTRADVVPLSVVGGGR